MATINASTGADIIVPTNNGTTYRGLEGNDTYIISNAIAANAKVTIVDTSGANTIQLVDGLSITASKFAGDSVQLTLSNGAVVTVNNADKFTFEVGGNETAGVTGSSNTYSELASAMGVSSLPTGSTISDGGAGTVSGSSLSTGAINYSLSASGTSVAEGNSLTYTVTASASSDSDVTLTYNVVGDDNNASVNKATGADLDTLSGTVVIAAGSTSATFSISPTADSLSEGLEGIKVTVFDDSLSSIGSSTALISNTASIASSTTTLTATADVIATGAGDDSISGIIQATMANASTTVNAGDVIDGGAGNDTLKIAATGDDGGNDQTLNALETTGIETISVNNFATGAGTHIIDGLLMTGLTSVGLNATNATGDTSFTNLTNLVDVFMKNGSGSLTVGYGATVTAGVADVQNVTLSGVTNSTTNLTIAGVETVNVTTSALKSTVNNIAATSATTLNISGDQNLTIAGAVPPTAGTIDASGLTGKLSLTTTFTPATASITGGSNNDTITVASGELTSTTTYNGGLGVDTLILAAAADWNLTTYGNVSGFEVLGAAALGTYDFSKLAGGAAVLSADANDTNGSVVFSNMPSSSAGTIISTEGFDLLLAQDSAADDATVTIGTATSGALAVVDPIALAEYETVTVNTAGTADHNINIESGQMTSLSVAGSQGVTITITDATTLKVIDGSGIVDVAGTGLTVDGNPSVAAAGGVTMTGTDAGLDNLLGGAGGDTISGGGVADSLSGAGGADTIHGGAGNDLIIGGAGIDTLHGDAGNDNFVVVTTGDFTSLASPETISGGDGTDTLIFGGSSTLAAGTHAVDSNTTAYTIAATDLHNVDVEQIKSYEDGLFTLTVDDIFFTNSGQTSLIIDNSTAAGAMTVSGSTLSAANSLDVRSSGANVVDTFTGGKGDDIFRFDTTHAAGLATGDILAGGGGTDTVAVTLTAASMTAVANTNGMSRIEKITFAGSGALTANVAINNETFVTETVSGVLYSVVGDVDASGMVGTGALTFNGALETDSKMTITGGRGADIITGGSKADTISGGYGGDTIKGGPGIDNLSGGAGNDIFTVLVKANAFLLTNAETIDGGSGTDTIAITDANGVGVTAADLINMSSIEVIEFAGAGDDSIVLSDQVFTNNGATSIKVENSAAGTMGVNAAGVSAVNSVNYQYDAAAANIAIVDTVTGGSGNDTVLFTDGRQWTSDDIINGGAGVDTITVMLGTTSTDALAAGTQSGLSNIENINLIVGGANTANAAITTADANFVGVDATINAAGVPGVMTINAAAETDSNLTITGGTGNDILTGGTNPTKTDTISGGLGADIIKGGRGVDILTGGAGADVFVYGASNESNTSTSDSIKDFVSGTDSITITVDLSSKVSAQTYAATLSTAVADVSAAQAALTGVSGQLLYVTGENALYINDNADNLLTSLDYKINVNPAATATATIANGDVNVVLTGGAAVANTLTTQNGNDIIIGGANTDIIIAGAGSNAINVGAGSNTIISLGGADIIIATTGTDIVNAGDGVNTVNLGAGANTLTVGTGDDIIVTGANTDIIIAGAGDNTINVGAGSNTIISLGGVDIIIATTGTDIVNAGDGINTVNLGAGANTLTTGSGNDIIVTEGGIDIIVAGNGNNDIDAGAAANTITTGTGNDIIVTGANTDIIIGGAGNNTINAAAGANTIITLGGDDIIIGTGGDDIINAGDGANAVNVGNGANAVTGGSGVDTIIGGTGVDTIISGGGDDIIIALAGADIINSGDGADTVTVAAGADIITPGGGIDILIITGTDAVDTIKLADAEIGVVTAAANSVAADQVTGFVLGTGEDKLSIDISAIIAIDGVTHLKMVGNGAIDVGAGAGVLQAGGANATTMEGDTVNYLEVESGGNDGAALETLLEVDGGRALTTDGAWAVGESFLVLSDNNIDTMLYLIVVQAATNNGVTFAVGALLAVELIDLVGVVNATASHADNFVFVT